LASAVPGRAYRQPSALSLPLAGAVYLPELRGADENLLDSELFGHEAGAFTGASKRHPGRFERADGGTLFLDELATAPMLVQEKLLRVIEYGELERVGGSQPLQVNVRLVCATNADLPQMVEDGLFAPTCSTVWPSMWCSCRRCATQSDIMLLANQFAIQMCRELGLPLFPGFSERAAETLLGYRWPGNIRELKNVVERSVYRHGSSERELDNIINPFRQQPATPVEVEKTPGPRCRWICALSSRSKKKPAAEKSAAGEVQSEAGGGAAGVNLPPAAGAAEKASAVTCTRQQQRATAIAPRHSAALNHSAYWARWPCRAVKTAQKVTLSPQCPSPRPASCPSCRSPRRRHFVLRRVGHRRIR
jgi:transcriptional regulator with GAF, ATPase, and Fis domain